MNKVRIKAMNKAIKIMEDQFFNFVPSKNHNVFPVLQLNILRFFKL